MSAGRLIIPNSEPVYTSAGVPAVGATLSVYLTGTTTPANIYAEQALSTPISNPQVSNASGLFYQQSTQIWADISVAYDVVLNLANGQTFSYQNVWLLGSPPTVSGFAPINNPIFTGTPLSPTPAVNDSSSKIATTQFVASSIAALSAIPTGMINMFAMQGIPTGFLICDGSAVSRSTYASLFGAIGVTYGAGNGSSTFNLPDFRGYFPRGFDSAGTVDAGRTFGSKQDDSFQGHYHSITAVPPTGSGYGYSGTTGVSAGSVTSTGNPITNGTNGEPRTSSETRPKNVAIIFAIKT